MQNMTPKKIIDRLMMKVTQKAIVLVKRLDAEDIAKFKAELKNEKTEFSQHPAELEPCSKRRKLNDSRDDTPNCLIDKCAIDRSSSHISNANTADLEISDQLVNVIKESAIDETMLVEDNHVVTTSSQESDVSDHLQQPAVISENCFLSLQNITRKAVVRVKRLHAKDIAKLKAELKNEKTEFSQHPAELEPCSKRRKLNDSRGDTPIGLIDECAIDRALSHISNANTADLEISDHLVNVTEDKEAAIDETILVEDNRVVTISSQKSDDSDVHKFRVKIFDAEDIDKLKASLIDECAIDRASSRISNADTAYLEISDQLVNVTGDKEAAIDETVLVEHNRVVTIDSSNRESDDSGDLQRPATISENSLIGKIRVRDVRSMMTDKMLRRFYITFYDVATRPFGNRRASKKRTVQVRIANYDV
ncbi:uncharacterized protein LOC126844778 isoform X2 [Adelges cooleyi]|uniref:uncharacterized protein LOC126844778 isoform X2 n=1 Tax=Adelges cooleyi TaxID=133065 RepID=UPI00217FE14B|nr:uncharacterized protein LOC126844778 isoform X2 [Adelges cooleyi]